MAMNTNSFGSLNLGYSDNISGTVYLSSQPLTSTLPPVWASMRDLRNACEELHKELAALSERLSPISVEKDSMKLSAAGQTEPQCSLVQELGISVMSVQSAAAHIRTMIAELQL